MKNVKNDIISRQAAIELVDWYQHEFSECDYAFGELANELHKLPSAEPEIRCVAQINFSKDDLVELVNEKVAEIKAAEPRWIPVKTRPMDEEEKRYWEEHYDYAFGEDYDGTMFDCPMPEDGQEVWVCSKCGNIWQDTCEVDVGIGLEDNGDWDDIVAWMPFKRPEPWKGEKNERTD